MVEDDDLGSKPAHLAQCFLDIGCLRRSGQEQVDAQAWQSPLRRLPRCWLDLVIAVDGVGDGDGDPCDAAQS